MKIKQTLALIALAIVFSGCSLTHQSMREPNSRVEFQKSDFEFSQQLTGTATTTRILGIDWARLFKKEKTTITKDGTAAMIDLAAIPVIGSYIADPTYNYALYDMISKNAGYDVVFYPSFVKNEKRPIGLGFLYKITTVEAKAKLGKIK